MTAGKGNKHGGRKTRIKNWRKSKWWKTTQEAKKKGAKP